MPLSFKSKNHGDIAFGFFNIESDMLLLENYFFFADDFCELICQLVEKCTKEKCTGQIKIPFKIFIIANSHDIGDLMGAIHNMRFTGFIGETYKLFPFPENPEKFKQNPYGFKTQSIIKKEIKKFSKQIDIVLKFSKDENIHIGSYIFNKKVFHELIQYVDKGGYPRWKNDLKPEYVIKMNECIKTSSSILFE